MISVTRTTPENLYDKVIRVSGTAGDSFGAWANFLVPVEEVKLIAKDNGAIFEFSSNGVDARGEIHVDTDMLITIPFKAWYWRVKNMSAGENSEYKIEGFYNYF